MGLMGIVAYRPKEGSERKFLSLIRKHAPLLRSLGGISEASFLMKSIDGAVIEVFEWKSMAAKRKAMKAKELWELWEEIELHASKVKLSSSPRRKRSSRTSSRSRAIAPHSRGALPRFNARTPGSSSSPLAALHPDRPAELLRQGSNEGQPEAFRVLEADRL